MFDAVRDEFSKRSDEIDLLYSHIQKIDSGPSGPESEALLAILSSSLSLMLYNQIEATAFACVEAIYDEIHERRVSFDKLVVSFKRKILSDCKEPYHSGASLLEALQHRNIAESIARVSLNIERVFSGNLDAKRIREVLALYNLSVTPPSEKNRGADLQKIKDARKALAHGSSSFEKYGRGLTTGDLSKLRDNVREYMAHVINLTEIYLDSELYLDQSGAA